MPASYTAYLRFVELPSRLIDRAVDQIAGLPGVGRRTALRLALHLLARNEEDVRRFTESIQEMKEASRPVGFAATSVRTMCVASAGMPAEKQPDCRG